MRCRSTAGTGRCRSGPARRGGSRAGSCRAPCPARGRPPWPAAGTGGAARPRRTRGSPRCTASTTMSESRPKRVTNQGTPAAGMKTPRSNVGSSSRSASMSWMAWSHARPTPMFDVARATVGSRLQRPGRIALVGHGRARQGGRAPRRTGQWQPANTGVPRLARRDTGDEDEPPVGELGGRVGLLDRQHELASELAIDIGRAQHPPGAVPARVDPAAADQPIGVDVEQVGEVGIDLDLDRQVDLAPGEVRDVVVLVDAAGDGPVKLDGQRAALQRAVGVEQGVVGEREAGRVELDRRRVEQDRPATVDEQVPAADEAGVAREEAFLRAGIDAGVRLAHEDAVIAVDRHGRRSDLDRQGHGSEVTSATVEPATRSRVSPVPGARERKG